MKVHVVIGTRPQYVKWAGLDRLFRNEFEVTLIDTGQHYDKNLTSVFFRDFRLNSPDINLHAGSGSHGEQVGRMLIKLDQIWKKNRPDVVIVVGDTNSTLAGAVAAAKSGIPLCHLEAGIRSYNREMPEEINRTIVDHLSTLLWCPTKTALTNLKKEGITRGVSWTGDVTYEVFLKRGNLFVRKQHHQFNFPNKHFGVLTLHRDNNTKNQERLRKIFFGISHSHDPIIFPIHPRTRIALRRFHIKLPDTIRLVDPLGYADFLGAVKNSRFVITDSGGLLREAAWLGVPCIVIRDETEWRELVALGWNRLVGARPARISTALLQLKKGKPIGEVFGGRSNSEKMVRSLKMWWKTYEKRK